MPTNKQEGSNNGDDDDDGEDNGDDEDDEDDDDDDEARGLGGERVVASHDHSDEPEPVSLCCPEPEPWPISAPWFFLSESWSEPLNSSFA